MGSDSPRGGRRRDTGSNDRKLHADTLDSLFGQLSDWSGTHFPCKAALASINRVFDCQDVMILTSLPNGALQLAQLYSDDYALASTYYRQLAGLDRASWRALVSGEAVQSGEKDTDRIDAFWTGMDRFDISYVAAAKLDSPILPGFPGIVLLLRDRSQGAFSNEYVHHLSRVAAAMSSAMSRSMGSRPPAHSVTDARPKLPAHVFALEQSLEPLFPKPAWEQLDPTMQGNLIKLAKRTFRGRRRALASPTRVSVTDSQRNLWNFHAVRHRRVPALDGKSIVCVCVQPRTQDWIRLRPDDFAADPELARLIPSLQYVAANFAGQPSLSDIAANVSLSPFHFHRCFTERLGLTPKHFLLDCQIERAKSLLLGRRVPLSEVAATCGFSHQSHFTSRFKQAVGETPLKWRRRLTG